MKKLFLCFSLIGALTLPAFASLSASLSFAKDLSSDSEVLMYEDALAYAAGARCWFRFI